MIELIKQEISTLLQIWSDYLETKKVPTQSLTTSGTNRK